MKNIKTFLSIFLLGLIVLVGVRGFYGRKVVQAVQEPRALVPVDLPALPNPGLVPGDFFFFLDGWGERIGEFFTFRPEDRARLQAERVLERTAEIKALLARDGIDSPYLAETEKRIRHNITRAAVILERQKARGVIVTGLAKELGDKFDSRYILLEGVFETAVEDLEVQEKNLKDQIRRLRQIGDFERIEKFRTDLVDIRAQKERVNARKDYLEELLETEKDRIEAKMEIREREMRGLAREARTLFNQRKTDKRRVFEQKERALELQEEVLGIQLEEAFLAENLVLIEQIRDKLLNLEVQKKDIETEREAIKKFLDQKKEGLRRAIAMEERAAEQIEEAKEELLDIKEEKAEIVEVPPAVSGLVSEVESKLALAERAFVEGNYGKAFGQAMAAEMLARNAGRILDEKDEVVEILEELEEKLEEFGRTKEVLRETQKRFELALIEEREELKKRVKEARERFQERLRKIEEVQRKIERIRERRPENNQERDRAEEKLELLDNIEGAINQDLLELLKVDMVWQTTGLTDAHLDHARVIRDGLAYAISVHFDVEGTGLLAQITKRNIGQPLGVFLDGQLITAPIVTDEIREGQAMISGGFTRESATKLTQLLNTGVLLLEFKELVEIVNIPCRTDWDCRDLICPMAIGMDTPQCGPEGICICGPGRDVENLLDRIDRKEEIRMKIEDFFNVEILDERVLVCIEKCSIEIERAKRCVLNIVPEGMGFEEILRDIRIKIRLKRECLDETLLVRTCFKREGCYQLFIDNLKERKPEMYEVYKKLSPLLP